MQQRWEVTRLDQIRAALGRNLSFQDRVCLAYHVFIAARVWLAGSPRLAAWIWTSSLLFAVLLTVV